MRPSRRSQPGPCPIRNRPELIGRKGNFRSSSASRRYATVSPGRNGVISCTSVLSNDFECSGPCPWGSSKRALVVNVDERKSFCGRDSFYHCSLPAQRLLSATPEQHISAARTAVFAEERSPPLASGHWPCGLNNLHNQQSCHDRSERVARAGPRTGRLPAKC